MKNAPSSHGVNFTPYDFKSREVKSKDLPQSPLYIGWLYDTFGLNLTQSNKKCFMFDYQLTHTNPARCIVFVNKLDIYQLQIKTGDEIKIFFWSDLRSFAEETTTVLSQIIKQSYMKNFSIPSILPFVDQRWETIASYMTNSRNKSQDTRILYHYINHSSYDEKRDFLTFTYKDGTAQILFTKFLTYLSDGSTIVVEENNAGALLPILKSYIQSFPNQPDIIAFFSCSADQSMPIAKHIPVDSFSSCILTPARAALLYHSRAYYCFTDSSLEPIAPLFFNSLNEEKKKFVDECFNTLTLVLETVVESMAFRLLPHHLFYKLFRSDAALAKLTTNFILACRVLETFGIKPVSYPELPDMTREPEWATFDLRLDTVLTMIQGKSQPVDTGFKKFLSGVSCSVNYVMTAPIITPDPPIELSFLKLLLRDDEYCLAACDSLAVFLNNNFMAMEWTLNFFIFTTLFSVLERGKCSASVLFCITKILAYCPDIRNTVSQQLPKAIEYSLIPKLQQNGELVQKRLVLITLVLVLNESQQCCRTAMKSKDIIKFCYIPDFPTWSLHLINCLATSISESSIKGQLLEIVKKVDSKGDIEIELCIVSALSSFIATSLQPGLKHYNFTDYYDKGTIEEQAMQIGLEMGNSLSAIIRHEVLILFAKFVSIHITEFLEPKSPFFEELGRFFANCLNDPSPMVKELADSIRAKIDASDDFPKLSNVVNQYQTALLGVVDQLMADSVTPFSKILSNVTYNKDSFTPSKIIRVNEMKRMKYLATMNFNAEISTNLSVNGNDLIYGDLRGYISKVDIKDTTLVKSVKTVNSSLTSISYFKNGGYPLIFSSSYEGKFYSYSISNIFDLQMVNCFKFSNDLNVQRHRYRFDVDPVTCKMFSWSNDSASVNVYDLQSSKSLFEIPIEKGNVTGFKSIPRYPDIVAVTGNNLYLFDLRASNQKYVNEYELPYPIFDFDIVNEQIPTFAVCHTESSVSFVDARFPGEKTVMLWSTDNALTRGFAGCRENGIVAVGYPKGITCVNSENFDQKEVPAIPESIFSSKTPVPSFISLTPERLLFVHEKSNIVFVSL